MLSAIISLGDGFRFDLIKPVLSGCSAETLSRLESNSLVRTFFGYPLQAHRYSPFHFLASVSRAQLQVSLPSASPRPSPNDIFLNKIYGEPHALKPIL